MPASPLPASPYAYPVNLHQMLPADVPLPQPVGEAGLAGAAVMMQPGCIEVVERHMIKCIVLVSRVGDALAPCWSGAVSK